MSRKCHRVMPQKCRRIFIELAGTTCKAWCPLSATGAKDRSKLRQLHPSTAPFLVWLYFVLWLQPDKVVYENSDHFDSVNQLQRRIQHLYLCFAVIMCPSWFRSSSAKAPDIHDLFPQAHDFLVWVPAGIQANVCSGSNNETGCVFLRVEAGAGEGHPTRASALLM